MKTLKKLRIDRGLSQQALADLFNLSQQSIYKYENDLAEPDINMLKNFSHFFGVTIDYLVSDSEEEKDKKSDGHLTLTNEEIELIQEFRKLKPDLCHSLVDLIKHM